MLSVNTRKRKVLSEEENKNNVRDLLKHMKRAADYFRAVGTPDFGMEAILISYGIAIFTESEADAVRKSSKLIRMIYIYNIESKYI